MATQSNLADSATCPIDTTLGPQTWTQSGYPIVAGKYLEKGVIKDIDPTEGTALGPLALDVYWHNRYMGLVDSLFRGAACCVVIDVTEYLSRLGKFLDATNGSCEVLALNATLYSVNIIVATKLCHEEMKQLLSEHGLVN